MPNALTLIREDHNRLKELLSQLEATTTRAEKRRKQLLDSIEMELKVHAKMEEETFYPAFLEKARKDQREMFFEANEEHHAVDMLVPELKATSPTAEQFGAKAKVVKELIEHHMEEEEGPMFRACRALFTSAELNELGEVMMARRETLLAQWKNPITRPIKKLQSAAEKFMPAKLKHVKGQALAAVRSRASNR